jgi:hypothetical protein
MANIDVFSTRIPRYRGFHSELSSYKKCNTTSVFRQIGILVYKAYTKLFGADIAFGTISEVEYEF